MPIIHQARADEVKPVEVDDWMVAHKRYLLERPPVVDDLSQLFQYPIDTDYKLAIYIPMFRTFTDDIYPEMICKSAMHLAKSLLRHTDIREKGVPLYFAISEQVMPIADTYLKKINIDKDRLPVITYTEDTEVRYVTKLETLFLPEFDKFDKVVWMDCDLEMVAEAKDTSSVTETVTESAPSLAVEGIEVNEEVVETRNSFTNQILSRWSDNFDFLMPLAPLRKYRDPAVSRIKKDSDVWQKISEVLDKPIPELHQFWYDKDSINYDVVGWWIGISKPLRTDPKFRAWLRQWYKDLPLCDEILLELYLYDQQIDNSQVLVLDDVLPMREPGSSYIQHLGNYWRPYKEVHDGI